jgi:hypothetical protein
MSCRATLARGAAPWRSRPTLVEGPDHGEEIGDAGVQRVLVEAGAVVMPSG